MVAVAGELSADELIGPEGSTSPELNRGADGSLYLSWIESKGEGHALGFAVFGDEGWSEAHNVASGDDWFVNWADRPSVTALADGTLFAHWLQYTSGTTSGYDIKYSFSSDGGKSWQSSRTLNDNYPAAEHGFVSTFPGRAQLDIAWLDGGSSAAGGGAEARTEPVMALRHAAVGAGGDIISASEVDARTCDCCQTSLVAVPDGLLVAYRDRSQNEIRDIVVRRYIEKQWRPPVVVHEDNWKIEGCPINGPELASRGATVVAAWFTAASNDPQVLAAFSRDGGRSFDAPIRIDEGSLGHVDVVMLDDSDAVVVWVERRRRSTQLKLRLINADGTAGESRVLFELDGTSMSFPRMALRGDELVVAWSDEVPRSGHVHILTTSIEQVR